MATTRTSKRAPKPDPAYDELPPSGKLGHDIVAEFGDLAPSVTKIMDAPLTEGQRLRALTAFRASLGVPGDPNRHPAYAIEHSGPPDA